MFSLTFLNQIDFIDNAGNPRSTAGAIINDNQYDNRVSGQYISCATFLPDETYNPQFHQFTDLFECCLSGDLEHLHHNGDLE
jgi:hypothetical protein